MELWIFKKIEYKAYPLTIGDWDELSKTLRAIFLDDISRQKDIEARIQNLDLVLMRDYDESDIMRCWGRKLVRNKAIQMIFKNDPRIYDDLIAEFDTDIGFGLFIRQILKDSGITFLEAGKAKENPPPPETDSASNE